MEKRPPDHPIFFPSTASYLDLLNVMLGGSMSRFRNTRKLRGAAKNKFSHLLNTAGTGISSKSFANREKEIAAYFETLFAQRNPKEELNMLFSLALRMKLKDGLRKIKRSNTEMSNPAPNPVEEEKILREFKATYRSALSVCKGNAIEIRSGAITVFTPQRLIIEEFKLPKDFIGFKVQVVFDRTRVSLDPDPDTLFLAETSSLPPGKPCPLWVQESYDGIRDEIDRLEMRDYKGFLLITPRLHHEKPVLILGVEDWKKSELIKDALEKTISTTGVSVKAVR
jgi:hypothetical protein